MACLGLVVLPAAGAVADDSAPLVQATVYKAGGGVDSNDTVSADELHANAQCTTYPRATMEQYGRGQPFAQQMVAGDTWTLATIVSCLERPVPLSSVTGITIVDANGAPMTGPGSQLTPPDLTTPSDFQNNDETPVVVDRGSTDEYDRPWRGGSDLNFLDSVQSTPIDIEVFEGPHLDVTAQPRQATINVGGQVNFSATVSPSSGTLQYAWNFGGGASSSTGANPSIQFNTPGVWTVNLQVIDTADNAHGDDQLSVTVNQPGSSTTPTTTGTTTTGPNKSSGPTPGGAPTKQKKSGTQNHGTQHTHGKGTQTTTTNTQTTTTQTTTTTTQSTTTPAGGSSGSPGSGSPSSANPAAQATTGHTTPKAPTHRPNPKTPPSSGRLVQGELISDVIPLPADRSPLVHLVAASAGGAPARQAPPGRSILPIAAAVLAILALLGLGAQRELGRPRWRPTLRLGHIFRIGH